MLEGVRHWPLRRKLMIVPVVAVLLLLGAGGGTLFFGQQMRSNQAKIRTVVDSRATDMRIGQRVDVSQGVLYQALVCGANSCAANILDSLSGMVLQGVDSALLLSKPNDSRTSGENAVVESLAVALGRYRASLASVLDMAQADASTASTMVGPCVAEQETIRKHVQTLDGMGRVRMEGIEAGSRTLERFLFGSAILAMLSSIVSVVVLSNWIGGLLTRPIQSTISLAGRLAAGDLSKGIEIDQRDEIGQVASAMESTRKDLRSLIGGIAGATTTLHEDSVAVRGATSEVGKGFGIVSTGLRELAGEASHSTETARSIDEGAHRMSAGVEDVARSMDTLSLAIGGVADACRSELTESEQAQEQIRGTLEAMQELRGSATRIVALVEHIHTILKQTKLLALNATIEAVRAGEVGKGFAVVAEEVKQLATNTGGATSEIDRQMQDMIRIVGVVDERSRTVAEVMARIHDSSRGIASTMEEQASVVGTVATLVSGTNKEASRIAGLVSELAGSMARIDGKAANLVDCAVATSESTQSLEAVSKGLDASSRALSNLVDRFRLDA